MSNVPETLDDEPQWFCLDKPTCDFPADDRVGELSFEARQCTPVF
jgi:hypothetical protein